ncbi:MAG TPA: pilus assembly protein [Anaerolineaceae bacterium]|nr:pilus assembly protein [Anaerolineaceae bacterium]
MKVIRKLSNPKNEEGQSLVELAIGMTIIVLLLSGIFDVGRAIFTQFALQDAAEEGLVYGIAYPNECDNIESRVMENLENSVFPVTPSVAVTIGNDHHVCEGAALEYGKRMDITVSAAFEISMPFLTGQTINMAGTANGTILRPPPK